MIWGVLILIFLILMFSKYNSDKTSLRNSVANLGGMDEVFKPFISCIENDFCEIKIIKLTEVELEIMSTSLDNQVFIFGIKQGFSGIVSYRCDNKRSNNFNAEIVVQGNSLNQIESYLLLIQEVKKEFLPSLITS